jgi:hypothetical protein
MFKSPLGFATKLSLDKLISPRVLMAVEEPVTVETVGEFVLKGIRRPSAAYNVLAVIPQDLRGDARKH